MRHIFTVALIIATINTSHTPKDDPLHKFRANYEKYDYTRKIVREEAVKLNRTDKEHIDSCSDLLVEFAPTPEELNEKNNEWQQFSFTRFNSTDEIIPYFEKNLPPKYYGFVKNSFSIFKRRMEKLDSHAQTFLRETGETLMHSILTISQIDEKKTNEFKIEGSWMDDFAQILHKYDQLPLESRNNIERTYCLYTILRAELASQMRDNDRLERFANIITERRQQLARQSEE